MRDSKRDTDVENSLLDSVGERGWDDLGESCIISYMKRITSPVSMHDTGCSGLVHWDDPEGWYVEGGGRGVQVEDHVYPMADSC